MSAKLSRRLHRLAEEVLVIEERAQRLGKAIASTRGDALDTAYREGEYDGVCWVLSMIDMDIPWRECISEMEKFAAAYCGAPSVTSVPDPTEDESDVDDDDAEY